MEKKLDLEDTVRAVTEQPWARIRAFMKPVIPALAAVLIAALAAGCTMMDSVPQETPASEVEPPEALIAARVEDAEPADEQLKTPVEQAGASVLSDICWTSLMSWRCAAHSTQNRAGQPSG